MHGGSIEGYELWERLCGELGGDTDKGWGMGFNSSSTSGGGGD